MYSGLPEWSAVASALTPEYPDTRGYNSDYILYDDDEAGEARQTVVQVIYTYHGTEW